MARNYGLGAGDSTGGMGPFRLRGLATGFGALAILNKAIDDFTSKIEASAKRIMAIDLQKIEQPTSVKDISAGLDNLGKAPSLNPYANSDNPVWLKTIADKAYWLGGGGARAMLRNFAAPLFDKGPSDNPFTNVANENVADAIGKAAPESLLAYLQSGGKYAPQAKAELDRRLHVAQFSEQAKAGFAASVYNMNVTVNAPAGDRNSIGLSMRAALDARDRNNGRLLTTTFTRG